MRWRVIAPVIALLVTLPLWADTYPRPKGFVVTHYSFAVQISDASNAVAVSDTVFLHFTADGVRQVALDLCQYRSTAEPTDDANPCLPRHPYGAPRTALAPSAGTGMTVTAVTGADGGALSYRQADDQLIITLPEPGRTGEEYHFTAVYHGVPANGLIIGNNRYGDREFFVNEWPNLAHNWLATIDHPSMKATTTMSVTAPRHYQVLSNGLKVEQTDLPNDMQRTVWEEHVPICTWQISMAAAPMAVDYFANYHGIQLSAWVYPQERATGFRAFSTYTEPILDFYVTHIGPFSYEKLAQVEANGTGGGMELASDIYYGYPPSGPGRQLMAHEMAHQYFGDSVTESDWDDVWLSEGFATYFALLYTEHQDGRSAFLKGVAQAAGAARRYALAHPDSPLVHNDLSNISQVIANNAQIYEGGAMTLQMVRGVLGTATFWRGIRLYYKRYRNSNANDADLQKAMEDACRRDQPTLDGGRVCPAYGRDLSWFFPQWLHRGGIMKVAGHWNYDATQHQLVVTIDQTPNQGRYYQMPFQIEATEPPPPPPVPGARRRRRFRPRPSPPPPLPVIMIKGAHTTLRIPLAQAPVAVKLDPNDWVPMAEKSFSAGQ
ncbi:MAG: M1 family metallopeptidase [Terriglobales bacterium]